MVILAAQHGDVECLNILIKRGWQLGWTQSEFSPLMTAARHGHCDAVNVILRQYETGNDPSIDLHVESNGCRYY